MAQGPGRPGRVHELVRRGRQGHRRRHRPAPGRRRLSLDRGRAQPALDHDERDRPRRARRGRVGGRRPRSPCRARPAARSWRRAPKRDAEVASLRYFRLLRARIAGVPVEISRTGYTGDLGYEIWMDAARAERVWDALMSAGAPYDITPIGLLALDMARIEAGLILLDVDYVGARKALTDTQRYTPYEIGLGRLVHLDKAPFVGQAALRREAAAGPARQLVGLSTSTGTTSSASTTRPACRHSCRRRRRGCRRPFSTASDRSARPPAARGRRRSRS